MKKMKFRVEEVRVPLLPIGAVGEELFEDYAEGVPRIKIKGYKYKKAIALVETSEIEICLSGLPEVLQDLWEAFKTGVQDWVKEQEDKD